LPEFYRNEKQKLLDIHKDLTDVFKGVGLNAALGATTGGIMGAMQCIN